MVLCCTTIRRWTRQCEHITPVLYSLHWLPVSFSIVLKMILFLFKCLNNLAPPYRSELLHVHRPSRAFRSEDQKVPAVPQTRHVTHGDRAFAAEAPRLWNGLHLFVR